MPQLIVKLYSIPYIAVNAVEARENSGSGFVHT